MILRGPTGPGGPVRNCLVVSHTERILSTIQLKDKTVNTLSAIEAEIANCGEEP